MLQKELKGHLDRVWQLDWLPTGLLLVSCSGDKSIRIWQSIDHTIENLVCTKTLDMAHKRTVRSVRWNPDGNILGSCSFDATCAIWEKGTGEYECVATLEGHENEVKCIDWSCSGSLLATCSRDKSVWIWEAMGDGDFECVCVLQEHSQDVKYVKWHPNQEMLASASYDDTIRLWKDEDDDWYCFQTLSAHSSTVWCVDFNQDASVSDDLSICIWKQVQGQYQLFTRYENVHCRTIYSVSWSKTHGKIATCSGDNTIHILQLVGDKLTIVETFTNAHGISDINSVLWCPTKGYEHYLASCGDDHLIKIWSTRV